MKTAKLIETNKNGKTNTRICSLSWCHSYLIFYSMTASFCQTERSFGESIHMVSGRLGFKSYLIDLFKSNQNLQYYI